MNNFIQKNNKLLLPVVILITSIILGGFYYSVEVNKQKSIERQQQIKIEQEQNILEQKRQEVKDKEIKEELIQQEKKEALNDCIENAEKNYHNSWYKECKRLNKLSIKCIDINELGYFEYLKKYKLTEKEYEKQRNTTEGFGVFDYYDRQSEECSCRLPTYTADDFGDYKDKQKDECFKRYPQK